MSNSPTPPRRIIDDGSLSFMTVSTRSAATGVGQRDRATSMTHELLIGLGLPALTVAGVWFLTVGTSTSAAAALVAAAGAVLATLGIDGYRRERRTLRRRAAEIERDLRCPVG